jgi:2-phosphosulfolactate phosphatase
MAANYVSRRIKVEVIQLPEHLKQGQLAGKTTVIFDVLRATTTMTAALAAAVREIRLFDSIEDVLRVAPDFDAGRIRCGERRCLRPEGFELGNSPSGFSAAAHRGKIVFMATTNGTKAILAAREAKVRIAGALVNASAAATLAAKLGNDVVLLCAGTGGAVAMEDVIGAGSVAEALVKCGAELRGDIAAMAVRLFHEARPNLVAALSQAQCGRNVIAAGLREDIEFAAKVDSLDVVGVAEENDGAVVLRPV